MALRLGLPGYGDIVCSAVRYRGSATRVCGGARCFDRVSPLFMSGAAQKTQVVMFGQSTDHR